MPRIPAPRAGEVLKVKDRVVSFSYWPMYRTTRRYGLQAHIYASNPWAILRKAVRDDCPAGAKDEATAVLGQAEYFFRAAGAATEWAAKPTTLYYSFLNLAKALILHRGIRATLDQAQHGISEKLDTGGRQPQDAYLDAYRSPNRFGIPNIFADFLHALTGRSLAADTRYDIPNLLPQIIAGHRIWCIATSKRERFIPVAQLPFIEGTAPSSIWLDVRLHRDDLTRIDLTRKTLLEESQLAGLFREVTGYTTPDGRPCVRFEQVTPTRFTHRAADVIQTLVTGIRHRFWATINSTPPYRRYYLYLAPKAEQVHVLPQLASIYAIAYYCGSITRYRPHHFSTLLNGPFGEFLQEFLTTQPAQFLYLIASEFAQRDVTRADLV